VRGLDGEIHIKGGRAQQANTLVNTASISDPFTGQPTLRVPVVAVQSVRVKSVLCRVREVSCAHTSLSSVFDPER
jgi:hypothetical protein